MCAAVILPPVVSTAGADNPVRLWDGTSGEALLSLAGRHGAISACAFSPDARQLLSAGEDGALRLWSADSGEVLRSLTGHQGAISACAFSPDRRWLLSSGSDGTLRLSNADSGEALLSLSTHQRALVDCHFSPDGRLLLSAGRDGTLRLWDADSGENLRIHATSFGENAGHAVSDPRDDRLIEACGDAWRWLAWVRPGPDGWPERLPLETFGPMPEPRRLRHV